MTLLDQINKLVPENLKSQIKELSAKFNAIPSTTTPVVANTDLAAIETKLKDGTTLSVDKMEVGGKASIVSESGMIDAPDASYEAEDGTVITVSGGLITDIKTVAPSAGPAKENEMPAMMAALTARLDAIETKFKENQSENTSLKTQLSELTSSTKLALSAVDMILSAPAGEPIEFRNTSPVKSKKYEEMTKHEQLLFNKGKL